MADQPERSVQTLLIEVPRESVLLGSFHLRLLRAEDGEEVAAGTLYGSDPRPAAELWEILELVDKLRGGLAEPPAPPRHLHLVDPTDEPGTPDHLLPGETPIEEDTRSDPEPADQARVYRCRTSGQTLSILGTPVGHCPWHGSPRCLELVAWERERPVGSTQEALTAKVVDLCYSDSFAALPTEETVSALYDALNYVRAAERSAMGEDDPGASGVLLEINTLGLDESAIANMTSSARRAVEGRGIAVRVVGKDDDTHWTHIWLKHPSSSAYSCGSCGLGRDDPGAKEICSVHLAQQPDGPETGGPDAG